MLGFSFVLITCQNLLASTRWHLKKKKVPFTKGNLFCSKNSCHIPIITMTTEKMKGERVRIICFAFRFGNVCFKQGLRNIPGTFLTEYFCA